MVDFSTANSSLSLTYPAFDDLLVVNVVDARGCDGSDSKDGRQSTVCAHKQELRRDARPLLVVAPSLDTCQHL